MTIETEYSPDPDKIMSVALGPQHPGAGYFLQDAIKDGKAVVGKTLRYSDVGAGRKRTIGFRFLDVVPGKRISFKRPNEGMLRSLLYNLEVEVEIKPLPDGRSQYVIRETCTGLQKSSLYDSGSRTRELQSAIKQLAAEAEKSPSP